MLLGEKIDKLYELKVKKDGLTAELSELGKEIYAMEYGLLTEMEDLGIDKVQATKGTATRSVNMYPQVKDKQAFVSWILDNNKVEMIQSRVSAGVFREYFEETGEYPDGIDTYQKSTILFRKSK